MAIVRTIRRALHRAGVDVVRYPGLGPAVMLVRMLDHAGVETVIDVGANGGRYGREIRDAGWTGSIVSFEPLSEPFARLETEARRDALWTAHRYALGDRDETARMHIANNAGESSSMLDMLDGHRAAAPGIGYVGDEEVAVRRLDGLTIAEIASHERCFLKIDTQGFERRVLEGATRFVADRCVGVQLELSLVPMYSEGMSLQDGAAFAAQHGLEIAALYPGFTDITTGRMLQLDAVYLRPES
ncbi:FkbM family methyltransferase [Williamsia sp. MIQD14]|uniref:FkbM family methyltransferase n=1 Tax=Williamsia sp. MIQD14 TaxID=3425703 RepID=UPI003D9FCFCE